MKYLNKELSTFNFCERKKDEKNKCGRDFLFFALDFYIPGKYKDLESLDNSLGVNLNYFFAFLMFQFYKIGPFLKDNNLNLIINKENISSYFGFIKAILLSRQSFDGAIKEIEGFIDSNIACGIDVSIGFSGLLDHVMFVYGYDDENFYVLDTVLVKGLEYEVFSENKYLKKLPKKIIRKRWTRFGRVWSVLN